MICPRERGEHLLNRVSETQRILKAQIFLQNISASHSNEGGVKYAMRPTDLGANYAFTAQYYQRLLLRPPTDGHRHSDTILIYQKLIPSKHRADDKRPLSLGRWHHVLPLLAISRLSIISHSLYMYDQKFWPEVA